MQDLLASDIEFLMQLVANSDHIQKFGRTCIFTHILDVKGNPRHIYARTCTRSSAKWVLQPIDCRDCL